MFIRKLRAGAICDIGTVKQVNQDMIMLKTKFINDDIFGIYAVADGVGGLKHGDVASKIAIDELSKWWKEELEEITKNGEKYQWRNINVSLNNIFLKINKEVIEYSNDNGEKAGTTLSVLFIFNDDYLIKHIGDSRIYKLNETLKKLTMDHSWVEEQIMAGNLTKLEAKSHPKKNILTQCIGLIEEIHIFNYRGKIEEKDTFLLASDGFYNQFEESELLTEIKKYNKINEDSNNCNSDIQKKVDELLEIAIRRGDKDNLSAIMVSYCRTGNMLDHIFKYAKNLIKE